MKLGLIFVALTFVVIACYSPSKVDCSTKLSSFSDFLSGANGADFSATDWTLCREEFKSSWSKLKPNDKNLVMLLSSNNDDRSFVDEAKVLLNTKWEPTNGNESINDNVSRRLPYLAALYLLTWSTEEDLKVIEERIAQSLDDYSIQIAKKYIEKNAGRARPYLSKVLTRVSKGEIESKPGCKETLAKILEDEP